MIVCKFWLNHHHIMGLARTPTTFCSIPFPHGSRIPFPSVRRIRGNPLAVSAFGVVMAVNTLLFMLLHRYILRNLIRPELADAQVPGIIAKSFVGVFSYAWARRSRGSHLRGVRGVRADAVFFIVPPTRYDVPLRRAPGTDAPRRDEIGRTRMATRMDGGGISAQAEDLGGIRSAT